MNLDKKNFLYCTEKPDLQNNIDNVGVEVTQAITNHQGLTKSLVDQYFGKNLSGKDIVEKIKLNNKKGKFKGDVFEVNDVAVISPSIGLTDTHNHILVLLESIFDKSEKYKFYRKFAFNGVYCFTGTPFIDSDNYDEIEIACKKSPFQMVFINCVDRIVFWESSEGSFKEFKISSELISKWKREALNNTMK